MAFSFAKDCKSRLDAWGVLFASGSSTGADGEVLFAQSMTQIL